MNGNIKIQIDENKYLDLTNPKEKFLALTWVFNNGRETYIENVILNPVEGESLERVIQSENYSRIKLLMQINSFFKLFYTSELDNFLNDYLLDYQGETDKVKESRLSQLIISLELFANYYWDSGAGFTDYYQKHNSETLPEEYKNLEEYFFFYYQVWKNLNGVYDLIWDHYSVFVNKDKHTFKYFYSNKDNPNIESSKSSRNKEKHLSRDTIFNYLFNSIKSQEIFKKYEDKLVERQFLNDEKNKWLKDASSLIRFYNYCENKKLFIEEYKESSLGVKYLRVLFAFHDGTDLDKPSKRKKQNNERHKNQFNFLNGITGFKFQREL